jgi:hypothetical protein
MRTRNDRIKSMTSAVQRHHGEPFLINGIHYVGHLYGNIPEIEFAGQDHGLIEPVLRIYRDFKPSSDQCSIGATVHHVASGALYKIAQAIPNENEPWVEYKLKPLNDYC